MFLMTRRAMLLSMSAAVASGYLFFRFRDNKSESGESTDSLKTDQALKNPAASPKKSPSLLLIGDSIFAGANDGIIDNDKRYLSTNTTGEIVWAWLQDPRFDYDVWLPQSRRVVNDFMMIDGGNQGVNGTTSKRLIDPDELHHIRSLNPDIVVIGFGANDIPAGMPAEVIKHNIGTFLKEMVEKDGRSAIVAKIRPHVSTGATQAVYNYPPMDKKWDAHFAVNDWIEMELPKLYPGKVICWDTVTPLADPASYRGNEFLPQMHRDGVHLTYEGAYASSKTFADAIGALTEPNRFFQADYENNLLPPMSGTDGLAGLGVTGPVPNGWQISRVMGETSTVSISYEQDGPDEESLVLDFNVTDDGMVSFQIQFHAEKFHDLSAQVGQRLQLIVPVSVERNSGIAWLMGTISSEDGTSVVEGPRPFRKSAISWPNQSFSGWLITPGMHLNGFNRVRVRMVVSLFKGDRPARIKIKQGTLLRSIPAPLENNSVDG